MLMGEPLPLYRPLDLPHSTYTLPSCPSSLLLSHPCFLGREPSQEGQGRVIALVMEGGSGSAAGLLTTPALPGRRETLQDVSFTVMPGQTLALVRGNPATWPSLLHLPLFQCPW